MTDFKDSSTDRYIPVQLNPNYYTVFITIKSKVTQTSCRQQKSSKGIWFFKELMKGNLSLSLKRKFGYIFILANPEVFQGLLVTLKAQSVLGD